MKEKVVIAMSGGVDSSVAAALLLDMGYDVSGIMLKLWADECGEKDNSCCPPEAIKQARDVAAKLGFPFYVLDAREIFKKKIVDTFIDEYARGNTPNPCFNCNRWIRWGFLLDFAMQNGNDFLATGHYARLEKSGDGRMHLKKGIDETKDQSYVLSGLNQEQLSHTLLPLGSYRKTQIRGIAHEKGLAVADKHDSQDLCFVGKGGYRNFLQRNAPQSFANGKIVNTEGIQLGTHSGLANFTIGQRKGLGAGNDEPIYVIRKNEVANEVVVGKRTDLGTQQFTVREFSGFPAEGDNLRDFMVKTRYKAAPVACRISHNEGDQIEVLLEKPVMDITPGQIAVFYDQDEVVASGIIQ